MSWSTFGTSNATGAAASRTTPIYRLIMSSPRQPANPSADGLQRAFGMDASYDVNALYNLAPICGTCNREKSDADLTEYGVLLTTLRKAKKIAPKVARRVELFGTTSKLADALLHVAEADLSDKATRATFEREAPAVC